MCHLPGRRPGGAPLLAFIFLLLGAAVLTAQVSRPANDQDEPVPLEFFGTGHTVHGDWRAEVTATRDQWRSGQAVGVSVSLQFGDAHLASLAAAGIRADKLCVLITAERTFDADGWMRLASDERMSTLLTPTGLAIEGGVQAAVTNRYGYQFRSPLDQFVSMPIAEARASGAGDRLALFSTTATLPLALPPGLYRLRVDVGVMVGTRAYNFNGFTFASRAFSNEAGTSTYFYSPLIPASASHVSGRSVDATRISPRFPWLLLSNYNSNGYRGVVADEDRTRFATSDRSLMPDEVILPMYDDNGNRLAYSLEPQFPVDTIDALQNIPWNWTKGELSVRIAGPDGGIVDLGTAPIVAKSGNGPTTKASAFTTWRPPKYGRYTVTTTGWIADQQGNRYVGGGTYRFWIAKRMTLATATFQGMPYPVGSTYGRDIQFNPPMPADVEVTATLYVNSNIDDARTLSYSGKATSAGLFGAAQGMKSFALSAPGEYHAQVLATYTDAEGHLWVSTMRHAGIVYAEPSSVIARGKKFLLDGKYVERGDTRFEGYIEDDGTQHLAHITFPYQAGDVLLIAAEGQGANKIEPVLIYQMPGDTSAWDTRLNGVGTTNLRINTSNGYSPHLYPEYITDIEYYYGAAPRPGFMGRFLVGESTVLAPYWPVSPNSFGGQIGSTSNGDAPGDIYRLIGGVVLRRLNQAPMYAGYIASAFLLPKGTGNNRVIVPGSELLNGPTGEQARFFLVGLRPGTAYELGATFRPAVQIDPILPVSIHFVLTYPDGRQQVVDGVADRFGSFAGPAAFPLDVPGVYRYQLRATWNGYEGRMPGLPDSGGVFYVYSKTRPAGVAGLKLDGATTRTFAPAATLTVGGTSAASVVHYALLTPGAVIEQGDLPVRGGRFQYVFDPVAVHGKVPLYDVVSITTGRPQLGRVVHLSLFSEEPAPGGTFFDFARVILRGTTAIAARAPIPATATLAEAAGVIGVGAQGASQGPRPIQLAVTDAGSLRDWDARVDRAIRARDLVLVSRTADTLMAGRTHERLQQFQHGLPVFGGEITRQLDGEATVSIFGSVAPAFEVGGVPAIPAEAAQAVVRSRGARPDPDVQPDLMLLPLDSAAATVAWRIVASAGRDVRVWFVDAADGRVRLDYSNVKPQQVTVFDLRGDSDRLAAALEGTVVLGGADHARAADADTADLLVGARVTAAYVLRRFNRRGVDGRDGAIAAIVHAGAGIGASWNGRAIVFGDAVRLEPAIVAHEWTHAMLDVSTGLIYRGETAAVSEALATIVASAVQTTHAGAAATSGTANNIGVRVFEDAVAAGATREQMEQVFYRAVVYMLPANGSFETLRAASVQAARDLFGAGSEAEHILVAAWAAAGMP